jgi:hypothetical protein
MMTSQLPESVKLYFLSSCRWVGILYSRMAPHHPTDSSPAPAPVQTEVQVPTGMCEPHVFGGHTTTVKVIGDVRLGEQVQAPTEIRGRRIVERAPLLSETRSMVDPKTVSVVAFGSEVCNVVLR